MNPIKLTVLMPVLNGMPYLPEALASIEQQSGVEFSILAWDNGSSDGSVAVLKEWIPRRLPGEVITNRPLSLGGSCAALVTKAKTEFCARMDADDVCLPERFARQVNALMEDERLAVVGGQVETIDSLGQPYSLKKLEYLTQDADIVHQMLMYTGFAHPAVCFRRSAVIEVGNYREMIPEDYDLWLRLAARHRLRNLEEKVIRYRFHEGSASQTGRPGYMPDPINRAFAAAGVELYGCKEEELLDLRERKLLFAGPVLIKILRQLSHRDGLGLTERLRMRSFREAMHQLLGPQDLATRLGVALFRPNPLLVYREAKQVLIEFMEWQYR